MGTWPLSVAQLDIWRTQKMAPDDTLYNIGGYVERTGVVDHASFSVAVRHSLSEADSLRLHILESVEGPRQGLQPYADAEISFVDLSNSADARASAEHWMRQAMDRPFDLATGPLFRVALIKIADERALWFGMFHHLVTDLFGAALFLARVAELHDAGEDTAAATLELTAWADALSDETEYRSSVRYQRDREFWLEQLLQRPPPVTLSGQPPGWQHHSVECTASISARRFKQLNELGAAHKIGAVAVIYASVALYLARMTGSLDLIIGMPVAARTSARLRRSTGVLTNTVPLRLQVDLAGSFDELVARTAIRIREAFRHQRYPASAVRADQHLAANDASLYGLLVNFIPNDASFVSGGQSIRMHSFAPAYRVGDLMISIFASDEDSDARVHFSADADHFDAGALQEHLRNFLHLLDCAVEDSRRPVGLLPILDVPQRQRLLQEWSHSGPADANNVLELFAQQVRRDPQAVAVVGAERSLSYGELDARSNALARQLLKRGVGPERVVGLWADRTVEMLIGLLGILKAGGAYLPLDPAYPAQRLKMMLADAQPMVLVGSKAAGAADLPASLAVLPLDAALPIAARDSDSVALPLPLPAHPAYVIYTSGSTGTPKGVMVTHAGLANLATTHITRLRITPQSRVLQLASLSFDTSVSEVVMSLLAGAALVLTPVPALGGLGLRELLIKERVSHATIPPAILATLGEAQELPLECLVVAGEACPAELIARWCGRVRMFNAYGPTESTVCATMSTALEESGPAPIGTPLEGVRVYVLDAALEPVPVGAEGELYIGGVGLARGYLNRPGLTAQRFVADPYAGPGARMYRSGDLARWRPDGVLEYLGRADQQVKVRGQRIELEEIEAALLASPSVAQAAVTVREDRGTGKYLAAFVVLRSGHTLEAEALRAELSQQLPQYMVPATYLALEQLPLSPSGKLDRRALPQHTGSAPAAPYEPPQTPTEVRLAKIWAELLRLERVGRNENFFALGGDSLLLIQFVDWLAREGQRIDLRTLFAHATVAACAAVIETVGPAGRSRDPEPLPVLAPHLLEALATRVPGGAGNIKGVFALTPMQLGILARYRATQTDAYTLRALLSFDSRARLEEFISALQWAIDRHDALRTAVYWEQLPQPVQVVWRSAALAVEQATPQDRLSAAALWGRAATRLDVRQAPMLRLLVASDSDADRWLALLQAHHLVLDHNSLKQLLREVRLRIAGREGTLPAPLALQDSLLQARLGEEAQTHEAFFRDRLSGLDGPTAPFGQLDVRGDGSGIEETSRPLSPKLAQGVREQARRCGVAASTLFHLAWGLVLARTTTREDVVFGTVLLGRAQGGLPASGGVGLHINTLPLRLQLAALTVAEAVVQTQERLGELLVHEQASLVSVQRLSPLDSGLPLFSTVFNFRHDPDALAVTRDVELSAGVRLLRTEERSNYPLSVSIDDSSRGFNLSVYAVEQIGSAAFFEFMVAALEALVVALEKESGQPLSALVIAGPVCATQPSLARRAVYEPPGTPTEVLMAGIWSELLNLKQIGRNDNFFALGGDSLLLIHFNDRLHQEGWQIDTSMLFKRPTIAQLAGLLVPVRASDASADLAPSLASVEPHQLEKIAAHVAGGVTNIEDVYPLGPLQLGMLVHHRTASRDAYVGRVLLGFEQRERLEGFTRALQWVVDRHAALRAAVQWQGLSAPVQVIWRSAPVEVAALTSDANAPEERVWEQGLAPMDVTRAPLIRLVSAQDQVRNRWLLLVQSHHLVVDHHSLELLIAEVGARMAGQEASLPAPSRQRAVEQRSGSQAAADEDYFRERLAGLDGPTAPFGVLDALGDGTIIEDCRVPVGADLAMRIRDQARRFEVAASSVFHLAWGLVLARTTNREDVVFGTVLFGRMNGGSEAHRAMGLQINTLPLRLDLSCATVAQALRETHERLGELVAHEQAPLAVVQGLSALGSGVPMFSSVLNYRYDTHRWTVAEEPELIPGVRVLRAEERTHYPLGVLIDDYTSGFTLTVHATTQIGAARIGGFVTAAIAALLDALEHDPQRSIKAVPVVSDSERENLRQLWGGLKPLVSDANVLELFAQQVRRDPQAVAVVGAERSLSYGELDARSNALARQLLERGVDPERVVGLWADRTVEMLIGLLGILKAGGAYLPLDPAYPAQRLKMMLADAQPMVLVGSKGAATIDVGGSIPRLTVDAEARLAVGNAGAALQGMPKPAHPAYVIYTSGSTGTPKGVVVTHAGLANLASAQATRLRITSHSRVLQLASLGFDASVSEVLMTLLYGATLVLARAPALGGLGLRELLIKERVSHATIPPAILATLGEAQDLPLECLVVAGEACPAELIARWCGRVRMFNAYGPTESTVCATMSTALEESGPAPIGTPLEGVRVYVLDAALEPVPVGAEGELYIGGVGLARGYLNRPGLTAQRFVADPYAGPGARMYRSGDLARWRPDGVLEYLGRADQQVKVRGQRIELEEIEAALLASPSIAQAAVTVREDRGTGKYLAAFVVLRSGHTLEAEALRAELSQQLPQYMVPATYLALEQLPLSPSGKLDRRALPQHTGSAPAAPYEPPQTPTEVRLAKIWSEVLRRERISRADDFFLIGGHSLSALQVVARVRESLGLELPLKILFDLPQLQALASQIDKRLADGGARTSVPIAASGAKGPAPLSHSQERMWLIQNLNPMTTAYNMAGAQWIRGPLNVEVLAQCLDVLIVRHEVLRSKISVKHDKLQQQVEGAKGGILRVIDLRRNEDARAEAIRLVTAESRAIFNLGRDPVIRLMLARVADAESLLSIVVHHVASDQWSMGVFGRELIALYRARLAGGQSPLPAPALAYRDFARWQRSDAFTAQFERQLAFWRRQLAQLPAVDLPIDHARPNVWTLAGASYQHEIPDGVFQAIEELAHESGVTVFMVLFAGFCVLLNRLSGQTDLAIGVPVANRNHSAVEGMVGTFVNTLVMRANLQENPQFDELLQRVRDTALNAFQNQDVSFDRLVQELGQRGDRSRPPLVQVLFNVTNAPMHGLQFEGLTWEPMVVDRGGSQFELTFSVDTEATRLLGVDYNTDLFERSTIERLVAQYFTILEAAVARPQTRISRLPLLPADQRTLLKAWNASQAPHPEPPTFTRLWEVQAAKTPEARALAFEGVELSYAQLNGRANHLARQLRAAGVGRGARVALCVERSPLLLIALLATQKAGGAYVPLDPDFPPERLEYMLRDSAAQVLVTAGPTAGKLRVPDRVATLDISVSQQDPVAEVAENLLDGPLPEDCAYVLYTSGSTGRPKGVCVSHGALANFLSSMRERPGLTSNDVLAAVTTVSFDIAGLELYLPLMVGARIELISRRVASDGRLLAESLAKRGVTLLQATPTTWRILIEAGWRGAPGFRALCGGEALPRSLADDILDRVGELWNMYGPTETTIWSTLDRIEKNAAAISIGRPIANTQIHILDATGEPVPIGIVGEICIGGEGVALGYWNQPALTAERFVPDPFAMRTGARLYRTGDRGRWGREGKLFHLGRLDHQIKIRGYRIELGEIEQALSSHPAVLQAIAAVREARPDDPRLVAFVQYREDQDATFGDLKQHLRQNLPDYMVPAMMVAVDSMPLTPNGKIDRATLPNPFASGTVEIRTAEPAATQMERTLAEIWKSVLNIPQVSALDNFFELGGYSLLSLRVANMVEKRTGRALDPRALFFQNLREVAGTLESQDSPGGA